MAQQSPHQSPESSVAGLRLSFLQGILELEQRTQRPPTMWIASRSNTVGQFVARGIFFPRRDSEGAEVCVTANLAAIHDPLEARTHPDALGELASITCTDFDAPARRIRRIAAHEHGGLSYFLQAGSEPTFIQTPPGFAMAEDVAEQTAGLIAHLSQEPSWLPAY